ncbi:MAG TPA: 2Fe-2S iron-sulfur cluster-binding protein [Chloroflexota bacterium]|jgi:predicted molibdopterin-dependent oxidoreductase YjgC|nr:2Fe-2S iron-sulfur cluster-binding protein [Chloroflexota bacterium]
MSSVSLSIDGQSVQAESGDTILDVILKLGTELPHLCKDPDQPPLATCRTCLVEIDGQYGVQAACTTRVESGLVVLTQSANAVRLRRGVLQLTLDMLGQSDLQLLGELGIAADAHGIVGSSVQYAVGPASLDDSNPFWVLDRDRCILCQRCVAACQDVQRIYALTVLDRSAETSIGVFDHRLIAESNCTSCGQCWATCPSLAIRQKHPLSAESPVSQ